MWAAYATLGVRVTSETTWGDVYSAYRRRCRETHPDLHGVESTQAFLEVQQAYEYLLWLQAELDAQGVLEVEDLVWEDDAITEAPAPSPEPAPVFVVPRLHGGWRRRWRGEPDPNAYQPQRVAEDGPRRAAS